MKIYTFLLTTIVALLVCVGCGADKDMIDDGVEFFYMNSNKFYISIGNTETITIFISPEDHPGIELLWKSSDNNIVTVDNTGKVTAISEGEVTITATSATNSKKFTSCTVVVCPENTYSLLSIPTDGSTIDGDTWIIVDDYSYKKDDFTNLRGALYSAGRDISLEFPYLDSFPSGAFSVDNISLDNLYSVVAPVATIIESAAFSGCKSLVNVSFPNVCGIGMYVFRNCEALESINLPSAIDICSYAFNNCNSLKSINLPMLEHIFSACFSDCDNLISVELPNAKDLDSDIFSGCDKISSLLIATESTLSDVDIDTFSGIGNDLENIELITGNDNGSTVSGNMWSVPNSDIAKYEFGPFKSITVK